MSDGSEQAPREPQKEPQGRKEPRYWTGGHTTHRLRYHPTHRLRYHPTHRLRYHTTHRLRFHLVFVPKLDFSHFSP